MRVALAQILSTDDPTANLARLTEAATRAAAAGADLAVFPEATQCCFGTDLAAVAEPLDGDWASAVRALAARLGIVVAAGMFTPRPHGRVANTLLVTGPGVEAAYDKIHLYDAFGHRESDIVAPGRAPLTVTVGDTVVGLAVCYDVRYPELFRALADAGAETVVLPASWGDGPDKLDQWRVLTRARALDATVHLVAVDQADPRSVDVDPGAAPRGVGHSVAVGPDGAVLAELGEAPDLATVDLDPAHVHDVRGWLPVLAGRRLPDLPS